MESLLEKSLRPPSTINKIKRARPRKTPRNPLQSEPQTSTFSTEPGLDLVGGGGEGNADSGGVLIMELIALERVEDDGGLSLGLEVDEAEEVLAALARLLRNEAGVDEAGEGPEDVADLPFGGVVGDS